MRSTPYQEHTLIPDPRFPVNVFSVGLPNPTWIPLHWHDHLEWMVIRRGRFRVQVDAQYHDLGPGAVVFANTKHLHGAFPLEEGSELLAIVCNENLIRNAHLEDLESRYIMPMLDDRLRFQSVIRSDLPAAGELAKTLQELAREFTDKHPGWEFFVKSALLSTLGLMFREFQSDSRAVTPPSGGHPIPPLLHYLSIHFARPLTVAEAAARCHLSPHYFCGLFKKTTGRTLIAHLNMLRVLEAERLLVLTTWPISRISNEVGFTEQSYFGQVFREMRGLTPREYRIKMVCNGIGKIPEIPLSDQ